MSFQPNNRTLLRDKPNSITTAPYQTKNKLALTFPENSPHTRQEFKDECDINNIMLQYQVTGEFFHLNETAPQYMDCSGEDFRAQMDYVAGAFSMFEELPSAVRTRFGNDPAEFLDFCSHEKNRPELAEMGLLSPEATDRFKTSMAPKEPPTPPAAPPAGENSTSA